MLIVKSASAGAFESTEVGGWTLTPGIEARLRLRFGEDINYGLGAIDDLDETERTNLSLSLEPRLGAEHAAFGGTFYSAVSVVGAANVLNGELSGQFARGGDSRIDVAEAHVGWRNDQFSISVGPQEFVV